MAFYCDISVLEEDEEILPGFKEDEKLGMNLGLFHRMLCSLFLLFAMRFSISEDCRHVLFCPIYKRIDMWEQRTCPFGYAVFNPRRHFSINCSCQKTVFFKRTQRVGKHLLRDIGNLAAQFIEPHGWLKIQSI